MTPPTPVLENETILMRGVAFGEVALQMDNCLRTATVIALVLFAMRIKTASVLHTAWASVVVLMMLLALQPIIDAATIGATMD